MSEKRFKFYPTSNYILDRETEHTYFCNNRNVCKLLNELNDKNQKICGVLVKHNIDSIDKLDHILMYARKW